MAYEVRALSTDDPTLFDMYEVVDENGAVCAILPEDEAHSYKPHPI